MAERNPEEDYFAKIEREKMEKLREKVEKEREVAQLKERQEKFWHRCGKCGGKMDTHTFRGVDIEICPDCGAVLLDHGELETLAGQDQSGIMHSIAAMFRNT